ncbi:11736_t:CDS:2 [Diversispora eburnea]|uniref:11736_t:CDS:1 n=1 Tax=Diversispora eburnea TaxID=1213867 RepID=A0A9N8VT12_9GLOM|nr:11736_t:CDS:2 [Diversispora eburnea]
MEQEYLRPFYQLLSNNQLQSALTAWLPEKLQDYLPGIMAVDMFITSFVAAAISTILYGLSKSILSIFSSGISFQKGIITMQIEYYVESVFGEEKNRLYEALAWLISQQTQDLRKGGFLVQPTNALKSYEEIEDVCCPPGFNVLPEKNQKIEITYNKRVFNVDLRIPPDSEQTIHNNERTNSNNGLFGFERVNRGNKNQKLKPSIYLSTVRNSSDSVRAMSEFINEVTRAFLEKQLELKKRSRWEYNECWEYVQALPTNRGLDTVALNEEYEELLKKELNAFVKNKDFYARIGIPYRRGILLHGKPGTGKTSLINAISSELNRDLYFVNLKNVNSDEELSNMFCQVPANEIIVLEDIDTQSTVVHNRILSTFLSCLDGHILARGNIIIMTTNHLEVIDPACVRAGRMDLKLNLGYATHYQINKMYRSVVEDPNVEFPKDIMNQIPERLLPPCEVMMSMVLYREEIDLIPKKILELVEKYKNMNPEEIEKYISDLNGIPHYDISNISTKSLTMDEMFDKSVRQYRTSRTSRTMRGAPMIPTPFPMNRLNKNLSNRW